MIITYKDLVKIRGNSKGKKIVFAGGTFDLLHQGHINYFSNLKKLGDIVVIAISTDRRVKERKGLLRPIMPQSARLKLVDSNKYVDYALLSPNRTKNGKPPTIRIIEKLMPDLFVSVDKKWKKYRDEIPVTTELKIVSRSGHDSTTKIISRIIKRFGKYPENSYEI